MHFDIQVGGGRDNVPQEQRWPLVLAAAEKLTAAGARVLVTEEVLGTPDHLVMADPEGNEFCLVQALRIR
jgi:predicted enzyme related to lactoylglutathione lyase